MEPSALGPICPSEVHSETHRQSRRAHDPHPVLCLQPPLQQFLCSPGPGTWPISTGVQVQARPLPSPTASTTDGNREPVTSPWATLTLGCAVPAGARWDTQMGVIADARLKELTPAMPVIFIKAIPVDRMETKNIYECPVYKTRIRGPTYVWTFNLKTKEKAAKWILAAVALLLQA